MELFTIVLITVFLILIRIGWVIVKATIDDHKWWRECYRQEAEHYHNRSKELENEMYLILKENNGKATRVRVTRKDKNYQS